MIIIVVSGILKPIQWFKRKALRFFQIKFLLRRCDVIMHEYWWTMVCYRKVVNSSLIFHLEIFKLKLSVDFFKLVNSILHLSEIVKSWFLKLHHMIKLLRNFSFFLFFFFKHFKNDLYFKSRRTDRHFTNLFRFFQRSIWKWRLDRNSFSRIRTFLSLQAFVRSDNLSSCRIHAFDWLDIVKSLTLIA